MGRGRLLVFERLCREELRSYAAYAVLARIERDRDRARLLARLAEQERRHYELWRRLSGGRCPGPGRVYALLVALARLVFGLTFTLKLLERSEERAIRAYRELASRVEGEARAEVERVLGEEEEHEKTLIAQVDEAVVRYVGFIALGLADAIVEVTGVHAGFLGATSSAVMAGVAGLVVGFAAAISMASAAYIQAKQSPSLSLSPGLAALFTGAAYIASVAVLALPFFVVPGLVEAFTVSVLAGLALIAGFNYYTSVLFDKRFPREFAESAGLMLGTALATYLFGRLVAALAGVEPAP